MREYSVGVDEAGRGPVIGPLIVCAMSIPSEDYSILNEMGVRDSKSLTKKKRESVYELLNEKAVERNWGVGIVVCEPSRIDHNKLSSNLNLLEVDLFSEAIIDSIDNNKSGSIFLDACDVKQERFGNNVKLKLGDLWSDWRVVSEHSMDSSNALVSAASIVAKVTRDNAMQKLSNDIGMELGSGYPSDPKTRASMETLVSGKTPHDCLRWTWSTVERAWKDLHGTHVPVRDEKKIVSPQTDIRHWMEGNHK